MNDIILAKIDAGRAALEAATRLDDFKVIADQAKAVELYAKRQKLSKESIDYARSLHIDATAKMGDALLKMEKNRGSNSQLNGKNSSGSTKLEPPEKTVPTLADMGVTKKESSTAQTLATVQKEAPEVYEEVKAGKKTVHQARKVVEDRRKIEDLEAKAKVQPKRKQSDLWCIHTADCCELMATSTPGAVDLIFADPPYNIGIDYGQGESADLRTDYEFVEWCQEWVSLAYKLLSPSGSMWVLIGDEYAADMAFALMRVGLHRRSWVKWYETFGVNNVNNFNRCSRHLFYCVKDPKRFVFNSQAVNRPSDRQTKYGDSRAAAGGKIWDDVWQIPRLVGNSAERMPGFPTQLPLGLLDPIVGCSSNPGDTILDPFCGSGTTAVAAVSAGRRFIGIEKNPKFAELARQRMERDCNDSKREAS